MMKFILRYTFAVVFIVTGSYGQMRGEKIISHANIKAIYIETEYVSSIEVLNTTGNEIKISYISEGVYQNLFGIKAKRVRSSLNISDHIQPFIDNPNDKLAAHKISAATLRIYIPKNISLFIKSKQASITIEAKLPHLLAEVNSGVFNANYFEGDADVHTISGSITFYTKNANITATTNTGTVYNEITSGNNNIHLISLHGDISVYKIK